MKQKRQLLQFSIIIIITIKQICKKNQKGGKHLLQVVVVKPQTGKEKSLPIALFLRQKKSQKYNSKRSIRCKKVVSAPDGIKMPAKNCPNRKKRIIFCLMFVLVLTEIERQKKVHLFQIEIPD